MHENYIFLGTVDIFWVMESWVIKKLLGPNGRAKTQLSLNFGYKLLIFGRFFFLGKMAKNWFVAPGHTVSHRRTFHVVSHVGPKSQSPIKPALHARASQALVAPGHSLPPVLQCVTNCISILRKIKF